MALLKKEILILIRDIPGLFVLFIMPTVLILVISLAEKYADRYSTEAKTPVIVVDNSHSGLCLEIEKNLTESGFFEVIKTRNGVLIGEKEARNLISMGEAQVGLLVMPGDTALHLLIDPSAQDLFRPSRIEAMKYIIEGTQSKFLVMRSLAGMTKGNEAALNMLSGFSAKNMAPLEVTYASYDKSRIKPTATQNNIPGYLLFAMFLIVIPVAGNMVNEKTIGFRTRFRTLPVPLREMLLAKIILYLIICILQFFLMFLIGVFIFPGFTGYVNFHNPAGILLLAVVTIASALAATGFGIMVGAISGTHGQSAVFGPLVVVILAAISGAFLPIYLLPGFLQTLSWASPMRWGIESYITVFFRHGGIMMILPEIGLLLGFFLLMFGISQFVAIRKR